MTNAFWQQDKNDVAKALLGQVVTVGNLDVVLLDTEGYTKKQNSTGAYKPLLEMDPGQILCAPNQGHVIVLISALDKGERGGCVLLRAVEKNGEIIKGPGRVAKALGLTQAGTRGSVSHIGGRMVFSLNIVATPEAVAGRPAPAARNGGVSEAVLNTHMPKICAKYARENPGIGFFTWVNALVADCADEAALVRKLRS